MALKNLFGTSVPAVTNANDGVAYELGFKFQSSLAGRIVGLRFYKGSSEGTGHIGHLWATDFSLLGTCNFTGEGSSGWQVAYFETPITIAANTTYVASVDTGTSTTYFSITTGGLSSQVTSSPLSSVADGQNGVFRTPPGFFPNSSNASSNYWRDVLFTDAIVQIFSGDNQSNTVGLALASPLVASLVDSAGNPIVGETVTFTAQSGDTLSATSAVTDSAGKASVALTLGSTSGTRSITASYFGSTVTFTATGNSGVATQLVFTVAPADDGTIYYQNSVAKLKAELRDAAGNLVIAATNTITFSASSGTLAPSASGVPSAGVFERVLKLPNLGTVNISAAATGFTTSNKSITVVVLPILDLRVNCGGPDYTDSLGKLWLADFSGADGYYTPPGYTAPPFGVNGGAAYGQTIDIAGTTDDPLYQTCRYGDFLYSVGAVLPTESYNGIPKGNYQLTLLYADISPSAAVGTRKFEVYYASALRNAFLIPEIDLVFTVGSATAFVATFSLEAENAYLFFKHQPLNGGTDSATAAILSAWSVGPIAPQISAINPDPLFGSAAPINTQVTIIGNYLYGTTEVYFGGIGTTIFRAISSTEIIALVPANARTGPVTVRTPGGYFTSAVDLSIVPLGIYGLAARSEITSNLYVQAIANGVVTALNFKINEAAISSPASSPYYLAGLNDQGKPVPYSIGLLPEGDYTLSVQATIDGTVYTVSYPFKTYEPLGNADGLFSAILDAYPVMPRVAAGSVTVESIISETLSSAAVSAGDIPDGYLDIRREVIDLCLRNRFDIGYDIENTASELMIALAPKNWTANTLSPLLGDFLAPFSKDACFYKQIPRKWPRVPLPPGYFRSFQYNTINGGPSGAGTDGIGFGLLFADSSNELVNVQRLPAFVPDTLLIPTRIPSNAESLLPTNAKGDNHVTFLDKTRKSYLQTFKTGKDRYAVGSTFVSPYGNGYTAIVQSEWTTFSEATASSQPDSFFPLGDLGDRGGTVAAGVSSLIGQVRTGEATDPGAPIKHAVYGPIFRVWSARIYPAWKYDLDVNTRVENGSYIASGVVPYGGLLQLDPEILLEEVATSLSQWWRVTLRNGKQYTVSLPAGRLIEAMQVYGYYQVDFGGTDLDIYSATFGDEYEDSGGVYGNANGRGLQYEVEFVVTQSIFYFVTPLVKVGQGGFVPAFAEVSLDLGIFSGTSGGPSFDTTITVLGSGYESRNSNWSQARGQWQIGNRRLNKDEKNYLVGFFQARRGSAEGFRWRDRADFEATATATTVDGVIQQGGVLQAPNSALLAFQLVKIYNSAGSITTRIIRKPLASTVLVYLDDVLQTSGVSVDATTGTVTFAAAPTTGTTITATFQFDTPVRFAQDNLSLSFAGESEDSAGQQNEAYFDIQQLTLLEVRV